MDPRRINLPLEVIIDILSWLPAKSVVRFSCVSKLWNLTISQPYFRNLHAERSNAGPAPFVVLRNRSQLVLVSPSDLQQDEEPMTLRFNDSALRDFHVFSNMCNGLTCMASRYSTPTPRMLLLNPLSGEFIELPTPATDFVKDDDSFCFRACGLSFIPSTREYKAVLITSEGRDEIEYEEDQEEEEEEEEEEGYLLQKIYVCTVGADESWRTVHTTSESYLYVLPFSCAEGKLLWVDSGEPCSVMSFNLETEEVVEMPGLPRPADPFRHWLGELGGRLALVDFQRCDGDMCYVISVRMLGMDSRKRRKRYCWITRCVVRVDFAGMRTVGYHFLRHVWESDGVLLFWFGTFTVMYREEDGRCWVKEVLLSGYMNMHCTNYRPTLLPLEGFYGRDRVSKVPGLFDHLR